MPDPLPNTRDNSPADEDAKARTGRKQAYQPVPANVRTRDLEKSRARREDLTLLLGAEKRSQYVRFVASLLPSHCKQDADDIFQDTCLAAVGRSPLGEKDFRPWFFRALTYQARKYLRDGSRREDRERDAAKPEMERVSVDAELRREELREAINSVLSGMLDHKRQAVELQVCGYSTADIAERLGLSVGAAKTCGWRGRQQLREGLEKMGYCGQDLELI